MSYYRESDRSFVEVCNARFVAHLRQDCGTDERELTGRDCGTPSYSFRRPRLDVACSSLVEYCT